MVPENQSLQDIYSWFCKYAHQGGLVHTDDLPLCSIPEKTNHLNILRNETLQ